LMKVEILYIPKLSFKLNQGFLYNKGTLLKGALNID